MRKRSLLIALAILALGLIGTGLSTLLKQNEFIGDPPFGTVKESYGFPLGWYGYSRTIGIMPVSHPEMVYWFSLESFLLDTAFWFAISSLACTAAITLGNILRKTTVSKILSVKNRVVMYFFSSLTFLLVGIWLCSVTQTLGILPPNTEIVIHPYEDLGLRLIAIGMSLVVATFYQSLVGERRTSQKSKIDIEIL